jgi:hypothetical protein
MALSAFGVEDNRISKARDPKAPSAGRVGTAILAGPLHGLVAGKEGHKLRAAGNEFAGGALGGALGRGIEVASKGKLKGAGIGGSVGGIGAGVHRAHRKGHFKDEK